MFGFQIVVALTLGKLATLTNQSFLNNNFWLDCLVQPKMISEHGRQVLSTSDDTANRANILAFLSRVLVVVQHI